MGPSTVDDLGAQAPRWSDAPSADLDEVRQRERRLRSLLANVTDAISVVDENGEVLFATGQVAHSLGYTDDDWTANGSIFDLVHPDDQDAVHETLTRTVARKGEQHTVEVRVQATDGSWADLEATGVNRLDDPDVRGVVITSRNITPVRRAERLASSQAAVLELIARAAPLSEVFERCVQLVEDNGIGGRSSIYMRDGDQLVMRAGRAPQGLNDYLRTQPPSAPGEPARSACDLSFGTGGAAIVPDLAVADVHPALKALAPELRLAAAWSQPILAIGTNEVIGTLSTIYETPHSPGDHERTVGEVACSLVAIAMERVEAQDRLAHQALHDALTGLPNRVLLLDRLDHALARHGGGGRDLSVLFCDLDRFKVVNDSLGHAVGDQLLVAVAERLTAAVGPGNTVARFGGDEFVVLLDDPDEDHDPVAVAQGITDALDGPFTLPSGQEVRLTVSIGLAHAQGHTTGDTWLRDADAAMYRAKEQGRDRLAVFDTDMRHAAVLRLQVESDLRHAVARDELVVHYQPVIDLAAGTVCGAEALVRWEHPERGLLGPDQFIGIAEETGMIRALGEWVLDRATADMAPLLEVADGPFQVGVNLSARQLDDGRLDEVVATVCARHGWPLDALLLEVTESSLTSGLAGPFDLLPRLRKLGLEMAIDDFGTGHSSLARLGAMPFDQVKIDRSFVASEDGRMVAAVVAVAGALDLRTCAEGIETPEQLARVRAAGCDQAQGYLFSRPLPLDGFSALVGARPTW